MSLEDSGAVDRRTLLSLASLAAASAVPGCTILERGEDAVPTGLSEERARELAERFAPTLYFDEREKWFPTDPRPYASERDGETVVDGFAALNGYAERSRELGHPPDPTLFYHAVQYEDSPLAVVQYWCYSVFDQFTTNFHWHDWEVLHVFVDTDTGDPQLYVASSHSRRVPNNEFLDPDPGQVPRILSELGSHSSALSINDVPDRFQRLPLGDTFADITNGAIEAIADFPIAYGLPRDEEMRLPYVVPTLDEAPIYDHELLPSVSRDDLVPGDLTVPSFSDLLSPPEDLPGRATGLVFEPRTRDGDADVTYDLVPSSDLEHVEEFVGPQLSFGFAIPGFAEDAVANHITTAGVPWHQSRYDKPAEDITDPDHRSALADRYDAIGEPAPVHTVFARVTEAVTSDEAPDGEGVTTRDPSVEAVALLQSDEEAVPTFNGLAVIRDAPEGEHRLTVNGAGLEPHSEVVRVSDAAPTAAGVDGQVPLVARENSTKLEVDASGTDADLTDLAIEDDFAGRLYDAPLPGPDAVYVHRGGAYTAEVRDAEDEVGAFRVNPADEARIRIEEPRTGKAPLAEYLADLAEETSGAVSGVDPRGAANAVRGLSRALTAIAEAARRAADRAEAGDRARTDEALATVRDLLERVEPVLVEAAEGLPDDLERAVEHRLDQLDRRAEQAQAAGKL